MGKKTSFSPNKYPCAPALVRLAGWGSPNSSPMYQKLLNSYLRDNNVNRGGKIPNPKYAPACSIKAEVQVFTAPFTYRENY